MNTDIRVKISLMGSRKLKKLIKALEIEEAHAIGLLTCLWVRTGIDSPKGILKDWDEQDIADAAGWNNGASDFVKALKETRWIDYDGKKKCYKIHDWETHQSWACHADERSERARNAVNARWGQSYTDSNTGSNSGSNSGSNTPILSSPSPYPSNTSPDPKPLPPPSQDRNLPNPAPVPSPILDLSSPPPSGKSNSIPFYEGEDITDVYWYECKNCHVEHRVKCGSKYEVSFRCPDCGDMAIHRRSKKDS